jgi:hypothetical protein
MKKEETLHDLLVKDIRPHEEVTDILMRSKDVSEFKDELYANTLSLVDITTLFFTEPMTGRVEEVLREFKNIALDVYGIEIKSRFLIEVITTMNPDPRVALTEFIKLAPDWSEKPTAILLHIMLRFLKRRTDDEMAYLYHQCLDNGLIDEVVFLEVTRMYRPTLMDRTKRFWIFLVKDIRGL